MLRWVVACAAPSGLVFPKFKRLEQPLLGWGREGCWAGFDLLVVSPWLEGVLLVVPVLAAQPQQESTKASALGTGQFPGFKKDFCAPPLVPQKWRSVL